MLIAKTNPTGIDWYVTQLQTKLHDRLIDANHFNLSDSSQYRAYGRCYRNKNDNGYIAENYESDGQYKEVYYDSSLAVISWFGLTGSIKRGTGYEADMHLVFFANLELLALKDPDGNAISHRADEELRQMVLKVIGKSSFGFEVQSVELSLDNVLREYPGSRRENRMASVDMHPAHCFRINLKLFYDANKFC